MIRMVGVDGSHPAKDLQNGTLSIKERNDVVAARNAKAAVEVAKNRRLFALSKLLQFCRNSVGNL